MPLFHTNALTAVLNSCCTTEDHVINILLLELEHYYLIKENEHLLNFTEPHTGKPPPNHPCSLSLPNLSWGALCRILIKNSNFIVAIKRLHFLSGLAKLQQTNNELSPACDIDFLVFDDCNFPNFVGHICRNFSAQDINPGIWTVIPGCHNKYYCFTCLRQTPTSASE